LLLWMGANQDVGSRVIGERHRRCSEGAAAPGFRRDFAIQMVLSRAADTAWPP
jgi:hypothetical protein